MIDAKKEIITQDNFYEKASVLLSSQTALDAKKQILTDFCDKNRTIWLKATKSNLKKYSSDLQFIANTVSNMDVLPLLSSVYSAVFLGLRQRTIEIGQINEQINNRNFILCFGKTGFSKRYSSGNSHSVDMELSSLLSYLSNPDIKSQFLSRLANRGQHSLAYKLSCFSEIAGLLGDYFDGSVPVLSLQKTVISYHYGSFYIHNKLSVSVSGSDLRFYLASLDNPRYVYLTLNDDVDDSGDWVAKYFISCNLPFIASELSRLKASYDQKIVLLREKAQSSFGRELLVANI